MYTYQHSLIAAAKSDGLRPSLAKPCKVKDALAGHMAALQCFDKSTQRAVYVGTTDVVHSKNAATPVVKTRRQAMVCGGDDGSRGVLKSICQNKSQQVTTSHNKLPTVEKVERRKKDKIEYKRKKHKSKVAAYRNSSRP